MPAIASTSEQSLRRIISGVLVEEWAQTQNLEVVKSILVDLSKGTVSKEVAIKRIEGTSPSLGKKIRNAIAQYGMVAVPVIITVIGLFLTYQANTISQQSNEIAREALEHAKQQAIEETVTRNIPPLAQQDYPPRQTGVYEAGPHGTVNENRKARLAKKAKERKAKRRGGR